jgi:hypothetical protein
MTHRIDRILTANMGSVPPPEDPILMMWSYLTRRRALTMRNKRRFT